MDERDKTLIEKNILKVVIFSDSMIEKSFISSLESDKIQVIMPEINHKDENFLKLFLVIFIEDPLYYVILLLAMRLHFLNIKKFIYHLKKKIMIISY